MANGHERLTIAIPNGEMRSASLTFLRQMGVEFNDPGRSLMFPALNGPFDFVATRARAVPSYTTRPDTAIKAGWTGTDILWESGLGPNAGRDIGFAELSPSGPQPVLSICVDKDFAANLGKPANVSDLEGTTIGTKFPNVTHEYFLERGIPVEIEAAAGSIEALKYFIPGIVGIIDVVVTGTTLKQNGYEVLDGFHEVRMQMIHAADKMSQQERKIFEQFLQMNYDARRKLQEEGTKGRRSIRSRIPNLTPHPALAGAGVAGD